MIIKHLRKERNLSQNELAHRCGWEQARVSHYETGRRTPNLSDLGVLATALEVPIQALVTEDAMPESIENSGSEAVMSESDRQAFEDFRQLSESNRDLVRNLIASLEKRPSK